MSLATRCPQCNTLFKVTSGQLQHHNGQVRCGTCGIVFSGIDHLTTADSQTWQNLQLGSGTEKPEPAAGSNTSITDAAPDTSPGFLNAAEINKNTLQLRQQWRALNKLSQVSLISLLVLLCLQLFWWQRTDIVSNIHWLARQISTASPGVQGIFSWSASKALTVEGSGMEMLETSKVAQMEITLRNNTNMPSKWPYLKIDLLDPQGSVITGRVLAPSEYMKRGPTARPQAPPISPQSTVEILAFLNIQTLNEQLPGTAATGFKIELFDQKISQNPGK